jgi:hypothetical protein
MINYVVLFVSRKAARSMYGDIAELPQIQTWQSLNEFG